MQMLDVSVKLKDAVEAYEERRSKILAQKERIREQAKLLEEQVRNRALIGPSYSLNRALRIRDQAVLSRCRMLTHAHVC